MSSNVLISVIMPAYNAERWLAESIQSILNQTFEDFELIIVDDGSSDNTFEIASSFDDPRVSVYRQENLGPATARNKALSLAKGKYIALQDADDRSKPERFEQQYHFLEKHQEFVAVGTAADYVDKDGVFVYEHRHPEVVLDDWNWIEPPVIHPSVMFKKQVLNSLKGYPNIPVSQDTLFLYEMSKQGEIRNLSYSLYEYRVSPYAISRKSREVSKIVRQILSEYMQTGRINKALVNEVKQKKIEQSQESKYYRYHLLLAKKYLWNNYEKYKSRKNSRQAFKLGKGRERFVPVLLFISSFLGEKNIKLIYKTFSKK